MIAPKDPAAFALARVRLAAADRREAGEREREAATQLIRELRAAIKAGATYRQAAEASGLTGGRVHQLVNEAKQ